MRAGAARRFIAMFTWNGIEITFQPIFSSSRRLASDWPFSRPWFILAPSFSSVRKWGEPSYSIAILRSMSAMSMDRKPAASSSGGSAATSDRCRKPMARRYVENSVWDCERAKRAQKKS